MIKNIKYLLLTLLVAVAFTSCSKEDIGGTATQDLAGEWMCIVDAIDDEGNVVMEDPFGMGQVLMITYNTNANDGKELWVDDLGNFWEFKVKVPCNVAAKTFGSDTPVVSAFVGDDGLYDIEVELADGKVVFGGAKTPSGMPADAIEFTVSFEDDDYPAAFGYSKYLVHGYRRTGFVADEN